MTGIHVIRQREQQLEEKDEEEEEDSTDQDQWLERNQSRELFVEHEINVLSRRILLLSVD